MHGWGCAWLGQKLRYAKSSGVLVCLRVERWVTCLVGMVVSWTSKVGGQNGGGGAAGTMGCRGLMLDIVWEDSTTSAVGMLG